MSAPGLIHVMAGALIDAAGRVLIARRPERVHQGGRWEFPGGKLETGESPAAGLARELREELGIRVLASRPLIRIRHDYGDRRILLDVHRVEAYAGTPAGREGQPLAWRHPLALDPGQFPAADRPVIDALRLPERLLITGADPCRPAVFLDRLDRALDAGIRLVQLRAHDLAEAEYAALAGRVFARCEQAGARLLLNRDPARVAALAMPHHGLHLTARQLAACPTDPNDPNDPNDPPVPDRLVGASCHTAADLARAARLGLQYAVLSPVCPTATHPDAAPLGWARFAALVEPAPLPVYALGGLGPDDLETAWRHGAQGVAAIRGFWPDSG